MREPNISSTLPINHSLKPSNKFIYISLSLSHTHTHTQRASHNDATFLIFERMVCN